MAGLSVQGRFFLSGRRVLISQKKQLPMKIMDLFLTVAVLLLFSACEKKDFSLSSDKKEEVTIVYGLLNPDANLQYIKIYKGFLTDGNVYDAVKDARYYAYADSIEVYVEEYNGQKLVRILAFDTTTRVLKDSGLFAYPGQILYTAQFKINKNYRYVLNVKNKFSQKVITAETDIVGDVYVTYPPLNMSKEISFPESDLRIKYKNREGVYPSCYEAYYYFYYSEVMADSSTIQREPVIWYVGKDFSATPRMNIPYNGETFYRKIAEKISLTDSRNVLSRHTDSIVLYLYKGGNDLYKYISSNTVGTGLNQEKKLYTNLHSYTTAADRADDKEDKLCAGIFSSRGIMRVTFRDLAIVSRDSLFQGRHTGHLKFTDVY